MSELEKPFLKNQIKKQKKQKINVKKPLWRIKTTSEKCKFDSKKSLEGTMNGLGKPFRKNSIQKIEKTKHQSEIAAQKTTNKKPRARKRIFVQTLFSHYFKIRAKKFYATKPLAFSLHFLFRLDQHHYSNLTSKIMKMCEQILKKDSAPIQFKLFEL